MIDDAKTPDGDRDRPAVVRATELPSPTAVDDEATLFATRALANAGLRRPFAGWAAEGRAPGADETLSAGSVDGDLTRGSVDDGRSVFLPPFDFEQSGPNISWAAKSTASAKLGQLSTQALSFFTAPVVTAWASASAALGVGIEVTHSGRVTARCDARYHGTWSNGGSMMPYSSCTVSLTAVEAVGGHLIDHCDQVLWAEGGRGSGPERGVTGDLELGFDARVPGPYQLFIRATVSAGPPVIIANFVGAPAGLASGVGTAIGDVGISSASLEMAVANFTTTFAE